MPTKQSLIAELIVEALGECDQDAMNEIAWEIIMLASDIDDEHS